MTLVEWKAGQELKQERMHSVAQKASGRGQVWRKAQRGQFRDPWRPAVWQIRVLAERWREENDWREI